MPTPTGNLATNADPMIGEILGGRYLVERLIDRGGMGLVYLATEVAHERHVVIKMLAPHWTEDADAVARFDREGERLAELEHPNIVEMFDVGRAGEQAFIAMEYIDGEPLRRYLKRKGKTDVREFSPIAAQILAAVGYAHEHEIMLRDIKPSNVMLCERDGKANFVKLLDFGLAKLVGGDDVEITKAHVVGTAGYLSPEQIRGEPIDVRVDVYALGVLFFVMLTGKSPIEGDNDAAILYNHVHGTPRRLADELPAGHEVPESLITLVHDCLAKNPDDRPADARAVAARLLECLPPDLLELPDATPETREIIRDYREQKLGLVASADNEAGEDDLSAEWTRPVLRKPAEGDPSPVKAGTWKNLTEAAQAATAVKKAARRTGKHKAVAVANKRGGPTRVGLPAVGNAKVATPRKPPPAKLDGGRRLRRTGPRQIVRGTPPAAPDERPAPGHGIEQTRPAGSGHVGAKERGVTRPDGSGHVREAPPPSAAARSSARAAQRPRPPQPPKSPAKPPGARADAPPSPPAPPPPPAPPSPLSPEPLATEPPVLAVASDDSIPIAIETEGSRKPVLLIVAFVVLVLGGFVVVAFLMPRGGSEEKPAEPRVVESAVPAEDSPSVEASDAPAAEALAKVEVTGPPGAEVRVDGELQGSVPAELELPVGRHRVEVSAPEHEPWETEVELASGENPPIDAQLVARKRASADVRRPTKDDAHDEGSTSPRTTQPQPKPKPKPKPKPASEPRDTTPPKPPPVDTKKPTSAGDKDDPFLPVGKKK